LDTPIWKAILAGLASFRLTTKVQIGNGSSTAFWLDLWLGPTPLNERFPALFSHSTRQHASVSSVLSFGVRSNLGPRLSHATDVDLRVLADELHSVALRAHLPDYRVGRLTNKMLSNKDFYTTAFRHLQVDVLASSVWRSAAPLKCKIFCWLAKRRRIPTNARQFWHRLTDSAACLSCGQDEDVDHLLLTCPRALETWSFFNHFHSAPAPSGFLDLLLSYCRDIPEATVTAAIVWNIWKR
jgi:hypothetical protein